MIITKSRRVQRVVFLAMLLHLSRLLSQVLVRISHSPSRLQSKTCNSSSPTLTMVYKVMVVWPVQDFPTLLWFRFRRLTLHQYQLDRQSLEQAQPYHHLGTATAELQYQFPRWKPQDHYGGPTDIVHSEVPLWVNSRGIHPADPHEQHQV